MYDSETHTLSVSGGLSIDEVRQCLNSSSRDLATLCKSSAVNMWAKFKPVNNDNVYGPTGKSSSSTYWKGVDGKCGINFNTYDSLGAPFSTGFLYQLFHGNLPWTRVTQTAPFRLLDFDGYFHDARRQVDKIGASKLLVDTNGDLRIDYSYFLFPSDTGNLLFSDIEIDGSPLSNWYFSVLIVKGSTYYVASAQNTVGNTDFSVTFSNMSSSLGTYSIYPFLSKNRIIQGGSVQSGKYCSIGVTEAEVIEVAQATNPYQLFVSGTLDFARRHIDIDLRLKSNAGAHTFTGVTVQLTRSTGPSNPPGTLVNSWTFSNASVSSGGEYSYATRSVVQNVPDDGYYYWISAYADGVPVDRYNTLMESPII